MKTNELTLKDFMYFYSVSERTAQQRRKEICNFFNLPPTHRPLRLHLALYERITLKDVDFLLSGQK